MANYQRLHRAGLVVLGTILLGAFPTLGGGQAEKAQPQSLVAYEQDIASRKKALYAEWSDWRQWLKRSEFRALTLPK